MLAEAIESLKNLAESASEHANKWPEIVELFGAKYEKNAHGHTVIHPPRPETLGLLSLDGLLSYVEHKIDDLSGCAIRVCGPRSVDIIGKARPDGKRATFAKATPPSDDGCERFLNAFHEHDRFMVSVQRMFVATEERTQLLIDLNSIQGSKASTSEDDGVSQTFTAKQGARLGTAKIENPVMLIPLRTFTEVKLEPVPFILRLMSDDDDDSKPSVGLFEADGGAWKVDAMAKVAAYLNGNGPDGSIPVLG